jgi:2-amino-4-hydroxy-6-hydroxymethyldihydropteridine diphosphokinase
LRLCPQMSAGRSATILGGRTDGSTLDASQHRDVPPEFFSRFDRARCGRTNQDGRSAVFLTAALPQASPSVTMSTCLIALGSNLGDRAATLEAAVGEIKTRADITVERQSRWHATQAIGVHLGQREFVNGAVLCNTRVSPQELLAALQSIETRLGRERSRRWADRTLDLDLLLYDCLVLETPSLTLPHPRMSFRRFVLEPAAEIAGELVHPIIGMSLRELLRHLDRGADTIAIVSPDRKLREELAELIALRFPIGSIGKSNAGAASQLWPPDKTLWIAVGTHEKKPVVSSTGRPPKLTILFDPPAATGDVDKIENWAATCRQAGRGPTLRISNTSPENMATDAIAAVGAVWPALGRHSG